MNMNRKQALKELKKNKKNNKVVEEEVNYFSRFIMIISFLLIALVLGYLFFGIFITKSISFKKTEEEKQEATIDNDTILAGQIFDQKEDSYYVLIYDKNDSKILLKEWKGLYGDKEDALKVYEVDSSNSINNKFIVKKDSNTNPTSYEDLKIVSPTLIKVEDKKVTEYTEGVDSIKNKFKE